MTKFGVILSEYRTAVWHTAIWNSVINHLNQYIPNPSPHAPLLTQDQMPALRDASGAIVPPDIIASVVNLIRNTTIEPLKNRVAELAEKEITDVNISGKEIPSSPTTRPKRIRKQIQGGR